MLFKKMIRDITKNKSQFISIFLMAFLALFVYTGICAESAGLEQDIAYYYEETNLADGWIYSPFLNDLFLYQVDVLGPTTQMERQLVVDSNIQHEKDTVVTMHFVENNTISKFYLIEGEKLDINDENGVWLDKSFADAKGLKIGDNITLEYGDYEIKKEIKGLGYSPEYVYHQTSYTPRQDFSKMGFAYLSYKAFPEETVPYNVLNVKFDGDAETYEELLSYRLDGYYGAFVDQANHQSVYRFHEQINLHKMMADVFPIVFIIVSGLMLLTTMTRIISHQRTQIGILKANGFKNSTITLHYISYGFILILAGSVLGLILGPRILTPMFYPSMRIIYKMPFWRPAWSISFVYLMALMLILSLAVSYHAISSISKESPSQTIKPKPPKVSTSGFVEKLKIWKRLSFNMRWNYRDAKRNRVRGLMTIIGVLGCCALLIGAFGLNDGMEDVTEWKYNEINHYNTKLIIDDDASDSLINQIADDVNGDEIMEQSIKIKANDIEKVASIQVFDSTDLITPTDEDYNRIEIGKDEVSLSRKSADLLGVDVGDTVKWNIVGTNKWVETKIDKIHADPISQGIIVSPEKLEDLGLNYTPTSIITSQNLDNTSYDGIKASYSFNDMINSWDESNNGTSLLINILILFACVLAIVVLYNLGLLSFTEIEREISTLKVLGFKNKDLRRLLLTQNLVFTSIGFILGIPIGLYMLTIMWQSAGDTFYMVAPLTISNVLLTAAITFSLSIAVNLLFSRKIKNLNMVESLKNGE